MDPRTTQLAEVLVDYCVDTKPGELVLFIGELPAVPLMHEIYRLVVMRGAYPRPRLLLPRAAYLFYKYGSDEQLRNCVTHIDLEEARAIHARIYIVSDTHTKDLSNIDAGRIQLGQQAHNLQELQGILYGNKEKGYPAKKWNVTLYPTEALSQEAGMSYLDYEDFVFNAMLRPNGDERPALLQWSEILERVKRLASVFDKGHTVRITAPNGTDITLGVEGRCFVVDDGKYNFPGTEFFTAPIEDDVNGVAVFTHPAIFFGKEAEGIRLAFRDGVVVETSAEKGEDLLLSQLGVDEGAKRLGELGIGMNYGITRFTKELLFDEKIGGTIHLALGNAYEECGGKNKSRIHLDIVCDLRHGGQMFLDGKLVQENGEWRI